jgi:formylglycine-generating enzyme required for sulfatase activity
MSDVFISYSRKDSEFGSRLHAKLTEEKRDTWMDWEDIPATVEWWERIREGILATDNFVLIISPKSIASPICNLEIAHARELHKRILPILYHTTDEAIAFVELVTHPLNDFQRAMLQGRDLLAMARDNWNMIAGLNWINFTDDTVFEEKLRALLKAVDTDFEYIEEHTRLLIRATDWEKRKRSLSLLLRDDDLATTEVWLETGKTKKPEPTPLQREYIAESRHVENEEKQRIKRLQNASIVLAGVLVLAVLAVVFAFIQNAQVLEERQLFGLEQDRIGMLAEGGVIIRDIRGEQSPDAFRATLTAVAQLNQWQPDIQVVDGVDMVIVPPGCFWMGSMFETDEQPVNEQCFDKPFLMDRFEVTNAQFEQFGGEAEYDSLQPESDHPREKITWVEARDFCMKRRGARLPTDAEWEYAARGPDSLIYPWGNEFDADNVAYISNSTETAPVGEDQRPGGQSWVGAYDMSGNVWEWVSSALAIYPYDPDDGREDLDNEDVLRVLHGGSFFNFEILVRAANRIGDHPTNQDEYIGFRCALSLQE